jgi:hypothetical protein
MRKLLYLLLALPLVIASCEPVSTEPQPNPLPEEKPEPQPEPVEQPVLTLTSDSVIEFEVEGGNADVIYTLENAIEGVEIVVECSADWVEYKVFAADGKLSLVVEANEGEEREATLLVSYIRESFTVVIKQEAKPFDGYELSYAQGTHYMPGYWELTPDNHNFYFVLSDVDNFATYAANASYLELDLWAATEGEGGAVPHGEYLLDLNDSGEAGTIGAGYTRFLGMDANQVPVVWILPIEGKVVVDENGLEGYLRDEYGEVRFRYRGSLAFPTEND